MHGYSHENPISMSPEQEEAVLLRCIDLITEVSGKRPRGYVAPWWEFSPPYQRTAPEARHQIRPQPDAPRFRVLLRPRG